ncbi:FxLYD domain-containing protein [Tatumella sp. OPLPL6]|uniref:FxLYD domain-containing protein n=1 Tax=Tatumella sp. OPLPL6 TaxID=1928657 RepID=UPI000C18D700|nr:FxLYD domain-containing protein [Tatumella sp. OPLPL6]PIJ42679.1 hypothetical protein BOM24_11345 [Tatumella sp. OPLPL6]
MFKKLLFVCLLGSPFLASADEINSNNPDVKLSEFHMTKSQDGINYVDGLITNVSGHSLSTLGVSISLLKNDVVVTQTAALGHDIQPGQTWKVHAGYVDDDHPDSFQIAKITALK